MQPDRLNAIRHHLYAHGTRSIPALADAVGASLATVRRDLLALEQQGVISRTHGAARIAHGADVEVGFRIREKQNLAAKRAIAQAAYDLLEPHSSVFLDAGTTVLQLVRCLRMRPLPLTIFTNGLMVAHELTTVPTLKITVIGGQLADASKFGGRATFRVSRLGARIHVVTDNSLPADRCEAIRASRVVLTTVEPFEQPRPRLASHGDL